MRGVFQDWIDRPVYVRTVADPRPKISVILFDVRDGFLEVLEGPGRKVLIPQAAVSSIEIDYARLADFPWDDAGTLQNSRLYRDSKRSLFEAERALVVGLSEEKADELALRAEVIFRRLQRKYPAHAVVKSMAGRARQLVIGEMGLSSNLSITSGPLNSRSYRLAKRYSAQLDEAISANQDEDEIVPRIIGLARHAGNALSAYPVHSELHIWFDHAEDLRTKLSEKSRLEFGLQEPFVLQRYPHVNGAAQRTTRRMPGTLNRRWRALAREA